MLLLEILFNLSLSSSLSNLKLELVFNKLAYFFLVGVLINPCSFYIFLLIYFFDLIALFIFS